MLLEDPSLLQASFGGCHDSSQRWLLHGCTSLWHFPFFLHYLLVKQARFRVLRSCSITGEIEFGKSVSASSDSFGHLVPSMSSQLQQPYFFGCNHVLIKLVIEVLHQLLQLLLCDIAWWMLSIFTCHGQRKKRNKFKLCDFVETLNLTFSHHRSSYVSLLNCELHSLWWQQAR